MKSSVKSLRGSPVALLAEGVDRNVGNDDTINNLREVALLAEGVDRNKPCMIGAFCPLNVALLAEGVDRNSRLQ